MNAGLYVVLLQIVILWMVVGGVALYVHRRDGRAPLDDIGFFWLLALLVYATLPPLAWLLQGANYSFVSGRLFRLQPEVAEVTTLLNIALAYAIAFAAAYLRVRRAVAAPSAVTPHIGDTKLAAVIAILMLGIVFGIALGAVGLARSAESYGDSYAVMLSLPLPLRQLLKILAQFQLVASIVLVIALLQRWPRSRNWLFLYLMSVLLTFDPEGSRTVLARAILVLVVAWHILIRPISFKKFVFGGALGLIIFTLLGIWRSVSALGGAAIEFSGVNLGEFDVIWGNAVEMLQEKRAGVLDIPASVRFGEFFEFVPSQLLWFEKSSLSIWYLDTFYADYKAAGGGLAFGALAQAAAGGGVLEAMIRGMVLGTLAGWIMRWIRRPSRAWWRLPIFIYLIVTAYQSMRDSTFSVLTFLLQGVIPAVVFIGLVALVLSAARRPSGSSAA